MAWETAIDRLVLQQIHRAEKGEIASDEVQRQVRDLHALAPQRPETAFHLGYARTLLGVELPEPNSSSDARRWYTFGRLRGHDRRGERNWVADLLDGPNEIMDLLRDPRIASQCLPVAMRTLFWCGNLDLAVRVIAYLASTEIGEQALLVDAALVDLLGRLERREDRPDEESTQSILQKVIALACFERLPDDARAGYQRALGQRRLAVSDFAGALDCYRTAHELAPKPSHHASKAALGAALAELRVHDVPDLVPIAERESRDAAWRWLADVTPGCEHDVPEAVYAKGILLFERNEWAPASRMFDHCLERLRRGNGRDNTLIAHASFYFAAAVLAADDTQQVSRALRLMETALETVRPDLESFYYVHEALKARDRRLALRFLDAVEIGRGTAPDQLLFVAIEYLSLGEADPAARAAERVLQVAVDLDQRIEAMRLLLTAFNMRGERQRARDVYQDIRELLMQRGMFGELEALLKNEAFVGQALDHLEIKCELVSVYEEMEGRDFERASLQTAVARSLRARKDEESMRQAFGILREVEIGFPELAQEDLAALAKLLEIGDAAPAAVDEGAALVQRATQALGHRPRVLVVGGNERQRRHHPRFEKLAKDWQFDGEWLMANYSSPQRLVTNIGERMQTGIDLLILLHWNRHETTEPALDLARRAGLLARTVHYAGFTSLQVCLFDLLEKLILGAGAEAESQEQGAARAGRSRGKPRS